MKNEKNKSMFGTWMVLFMTVVMTLFTACEKLDEDLSTKSDSKRTTTTSYVQNKNREVTGPTTEVCSWEIVTDNNGEKTVKKYAYTLPRELRAKPEYKKYVSGFGYNHKQNNPIERGEAIEDHTEDGGIAKFYKRTDILSSLKVNGFATDDITMPYEFEHGKLVFDNGVVQVTFDFEEIQFSEKSTEVKSITSPESGKDAARLTNTIATKYIGYNQDASENVTLLMEKGVTITSEDFVKTECKEILSNGKSGAYFLYRINKSDGTHEDYDVTAEADREAKVKDPFSTIETSNSQSTASVKMTQTGSTDKSLSKGGFDITYKLRSYDCKAIVTLPGSTQENLLQTKEPEEWTATFRGKTYTIPKSNYTVSNDKGSVTGGSEVNGYYVYDYKNVYTYTRGNNTQNFTPKGVIKVKVETRITSEDFVKTECKEILSNGKSGAYFLYRINKSDGTHEDYDVTAEADREAKVKDPFTSIETSNSQGTGSVTMTQTGSSDKSITKGDWKIGYKLRSYDCKAIVSLAGSTQENLLQTKEPEEWTATFRGKTYTIPKSNYTVSNDKGSVTGGSEVNGYKVYDYKNVYTYTRGNNTQNFTPKGVIKVKVNDEPTFFPSEWGKLKRIKQTVANNPNHNGFVYTWLLEFEEDVKLPVVVAPGSITPDWNFSYAEVTTVSDYNGGTYDKATGKWICTTASDKPNQMVWTRNSKEKANKDYQIARNQNWDEGHTVDGHPSTQTSRYQLTVSSDGRLTAKDTYTGKAMGSWK